MNSKHILTFQGILFFLILVFCPLSLHASPAEICVFIAKDGKAYQSNSLREIPPEYKKNARCGRPEQFQQLAKPEDIQIDGSVRKETMSTSVGEMNLRWPRKVETLFGRTPNRALQDAGRTLSRVLKQSSFPTKIQNISLNWQIVFLDEQLPETQIPLYLVSNCHPAWMTPPANIYVVAQRVVIGCSGDRPPSAGIADGELAHILLHEMGHVVESNLLEGKFPQDKLRAEGFASWFEQYSSDFSSVVKKGSVEDYYLKLAKKSFQSNPSAYFPFSGSGEDYARASMFFSALVERRGIKGLMELYSTMGNKGIDFFSAIKENYGWDASDLNREAMKIVAVS